MKKKWIVISLICLMAFVLTGCVSYKKKNAMFEMLKENGCIDVGDRSFDDYDDEIVKDMSPIPGNRHYYIYSNGDITYTINYDSVIDKRENVDTFRATVKTESPDTKAVTVIYTFESRKIFRFFRKMYYIGPD